MIDHTCPSCGQLIRSSDHLAGFSINCPHCRAARVQVPEQSTVSAAEVRAAAQSPAGVESYPRRSGRCFLCDRIEEIDTCYLRVNKRSVGVNRYTDRWVTLRCAACDRCYRGLRGLRWFRLGWALFGFFGFPAV